MTDRPAWADALTNILMGMAKQLPRPLGPSLEVFTGHEVSSADLAEFVRSVDANDAALMQLRLALNSWDNMSESQTGPGVPVRRSPERRRWIYDQLEVGPEVRDALDRRVPVFVERSTVISKVFEPWYEESKAGRSTLYWDHYAAYLRDVKHWNSDAIASLDATSTEVVQRLSDPTRNEAKQTKGLVVGYVQSGKTANFTGVIAKAIDAGYRMVIVLTGTIEILRSQTQRRLDMELVGTENIIAGQDLTDPSVAKELDYQQDDDWAKGLFIDHGEALDQANVSRIRRMTTHHSDFKRLPQGLSQPQFYLRDRSRRLNDPHNLYPMDAYVAVLKKNKASLTKLIKDLRPIQRNLDDLPVLIIDDESDQASVDTTNPKKWKGQSAEQRQRTTINELISELLGLCKRAQYIGYTATPFANVFIDPDDDRDLFPSDFLLSLQRPLGYMGVREFHDLGQRYDDEAKTIENSNEKAFVRPLEGTPDDDPDRWRRELTAAIDAFVLSGAIKKFRESVSDRTYKHHTMLVHESMYTRIHTTTADEIRELWNTQGYTTGGATRRLRELFDRDYLPVMQARADGEAVPSNFDEIKRHLGAALREMTVDGDPVMLVNSNKDVTQRALSFETDKVWRILVGGQQLSRGFTVEGLTISYFRRKSMQADTLMQAGRWFGFRAGYQDLVRLYIRRDDKVDLYLAFEALLMDEESFRDELRQYGGFDEDGRPVMLPRDVPPFVSQHLPWLKPTSRTKMWNARMDSKATAKQVLDFYGQPSRKDLDDKVVNFEQVGVPLLRAATTTETIPYTLANGPGEFSAKVGLLSAEKMLSLLDTMRWHPEYTTFAPVLNFIRAATHDGRIWDWAVVWPQPRKPERVDVPELGGEVPVVRRSRRDGRLDFIGSDSKHRQGVVGISRGQEVAGLDASSTRGVVLAYLVDDTGLDAADSQRASALERPGNLVVLFSLAVPSAATPSRHDLITWTVRRSGAEAGEAAVPKDEEAS